MPSGKPSRVAHHNFTSDHIRTQFRTRLTKMGTNYSQPLRGYKYSEKVDETNIPPYDPPYSSFSELYLTHFDSQRSLTFLQFGDNDNATFGDCLDVAFALYSLVPASHSIGLFARSSSEAAVAFTTALMFGVKCLLCDPEKYQVDDFVKQSKAHKVAVVVCQPHDQKRVQTAFARDPSMKHVIVISGKERLKGRTFSQDKLPTLDPARTIFVGNKERTERDCLSFIPEWVETLKLSRDAVVVSMLPIDSQLAVIVHCACVLCRCKLFFADSFEGAGKYHPTHIFAAPAQIIAEKENIAKRVAGRSALARIEYGMKYPWKKFWLNCGSPPSKTDRLFTPLRADLGSELHFIFCDGVLEPSVHEVVMTVYGKPVVNVFAPPEWRNLGAALPCDIRFVKIGTAGGPVVPRIFVDKETKMLVGDTGSGRVALDQTGWWDEEGALVIQGAAL